MPDTHAGEDDPKSPSPANLLPYETASYRPNDGPQDGSEGDRGHHRASVLLHEEVRHRAASDSHWCRACASTNETKDEEHFRVCAQGAAESEGKVHDVGAMIDNESTI